MTWIKTVPMAEADEQLRKAIEAQKALYPIEYETPVHPTDGASEIVASHSLMPQALYHAFAAFGAMIQASTDFLFGIRFDFPNTILLRVFAVRASDTELPTDFF